MRHECKNLVGDTLSNMSEVTLNSTQMTYRSCYRSDTRLVKIVQQSIVLESEAIWNRVKAGDADKDQINVYLVENQLDDWHKGVRDCGQGADSIACVFSEH